MQNILSERPLCACLNELLHRKPLLSQDADVQLSGERRAVVLDRRGNVGGSNDQAETVVPPPKERPWNCPLAENSVAVRHLLTCMANEIRNPLTSIKLFVQVTLEEDGALSNEDLRVMEAEIRRIEGILTTFLDFDCPLKR